MAITTSNGKPAARTPGVVPHVLSLGLVLSVALPAAASAPAEATAPAKPAKTKEAAQTDQVIDGFLDACRQNKQLGSERLEKIIDLVAALRKDEDFRQTTITEALRELYPDFAAALKALGEEETKPAVAQLDKLAAADDRFLAAESAFFLARAYLMDERCEKALPLLEKLTGKWSESTLHTRDALFLRGVSESQLLMRKEAIASLSRFLEENPNAPERLRVGAWRHIVLLKLIEDGSINDVQDRMDYSRRRLSLQNTGQKTRKVQDEIIAMLDKLIEEAEKREKSGSCQGGKCKGCKKCQGGNKSGGGSGGNVGGQGQSGAKALRRTLRGGARTPWADLAKKTRNPRTFTALKNKFPARYRQLVEQYYRSFQEDSE
jgi:tetratricopeptide (TPR) repeat protein